MKISEFKNHLNALKEVSFLLPSGTPIPAHFHITEMGIVTKSFIDCGGSLREERTATFQLWEANDYDHRLSAHKLLGIIAKAEALFPIDSLEIQVEYQQGTVSKFELSFEEGSFKLMNTFTDCLAKDKCGIQPSKPKRSLALLGNAENSCTPVSGCC